MRSAYLLCALSIKPAVAKISTASKSDHFRTKLTEANNRGEKTVEFENKTFRIFIRGGHVWTLPIEDYREDSPQVSAPEVPTVSTGSTVNLPSIMQVSTLSTANLPSTVQTLTTAVTLLTTFTVTSAGMFDWYSQPLDKVQTGSKFVNTRCRDKTAPECKDLRERFWGPDLPVPISPNATTMAPVSPFVADPCAGGTCFQWNEFRELVLDPFLEQVQTQDSLDRFPDDKETDALFSAKNLKLYYEVMNIPDDHQGLSVETMSVLILKLVTAALTQTRLARIEQLENNGIGWKTAISLPGCGLLVLYLLFSIHQIKVFWRQRNERNETLRSARFLEQLTKHQNREQDPDRAVAIEMRAPFISTHRT